MSTKTARLHIDVDYDPEKTDPEGLANAFDRLLETAMSTPGILDEYGQVEVDEFYANPEYLERPLTREETRERMVDGRVAVALSLDLAEIAFLIMERNTRQQPGQNYLDARVLPDGWRMENIRTHLVGSINDRAIVQIEFTPIRCPFAEHRGEI